MQCVDLGGRRIIKKEDTFVIIFCILSFNKYFLLTFKLNDIKENHIVVAKERYKDIINLNGSSNPTINPENMETKKINAFTFDILT